MWWVEPLIHTFTLSTMKGIVTVQESGLWFIGGCQTPGSSIFRPLILTLAVIQLSNEGISRPTTLNRIISNIRLLISNIPPKIDSRFLRTASKTTLPNFHLPSTNSNIRITSLRTNPTTTPSLSKARRLCTWFLVYRKWWIWFPHIINKRQITIYPPWHAQ